MTEIKVLLQRTFIGESPMAVGRIAAILRNQVGFEPIVAYPAVTSQQTNLPPMATTELAQNLGVILRGAHVIELGAHSRHGAPMMMRVDYSTVGRPARAMAISSAGYS